MGQILWWLRLNGETGHARCVARLHRRRVAPCACQLLQGPFWKVQACRLLPLLLQCYEVPIQRALVSTIPSSIHASINICYMSLVVIDIHELICINLASNSEAQIHATGFDGRTTFVTVPPRSAMFMRIVPLNGACLLQFHGVCA